jgi:hypothetical protein
MWEHFLKKNARQPLPPPCLFAKRTPPLKQVVVPPSQPKSRVVAAPLAIVPPPPRHPPSSINSRPPFAIDPPPPTPGLRPHPFPASAFTSGGQGTHKCNGGWPTAVAKAHTNATAGGPRRWPRHTQIGPDGCSSNSNSSRS